MRHIDRLMVLQCDVRDNHAVLWKVKDEDEKRGNCYSAVILFITDMLEREDVIYSITSVHLFHVFQLL